MVYFSPARRLIFLCIVLLVILFSFLTYRYFAKSNKLFLDFLPVGLACNFENECLLNEFKKFTKDNGRENSFLLVDYLEESDPKYIANCHYIFHGIGRGSLALYENDIAKVFAVGEYRDLIMSIPTCGNGYYHGVIEEIVANISDKENLDEKLAEICKPILNTNISIVKDCYHGLGHAVLIQENYDIQKSVNVCGKIVENELMQSMCRTGVFMEMVKGMDFAGVESYDSCLDLPSDMQKAECFNMQSYLFDEFSSKKAAFIQNMQKCEREKKNMEDKIICIRKENI